MGIRQELCCKEFNKIYIKQNHHSQDEDSGFGIILLLFIIQ